MDINKMSKEELETLSYNDIASCLLQEKNCQSTLDLFNSIGKLLGMKKSQIENKIGDFFTSLTTDRRFILLDDGTWDLKANHKVADKIIVEDEEDSDIIDVDDQTETDTDEVEEDTYSDSDDSTTFDDTEDEFKGLVVLDEDDLNDGE